MPIDLPAAANFATAPRGVDLEAWPPVLLADDPDTAHDQAVGHCEQPSGFGRVELLKHLLQLLDPRALHLDLLVVVLWGTEQCIGEFWAYSVAQLGHEHLSEGLLRIECQAHAKPEFSVVLEKAIGPGRSLPFGVLRIGRGRQVAAVDRRATGCVGDDEMVAIQLRQQFQVRRLAAT